MKQTESQPKINRLTARVIAIAAAAVCLGGLGAASAQAAFEQVGTFAGSTTVKPPNQTAEEREEIQLGGVGGMAVNYTGKGGVPAGTVYAATKPAGPNQVAMYVPTAGGGLKFAMGWKVTVEEEEYERCGPPGELPNGETVHPNCSPRLAGVRGSVDVDVNQETGNVYVQLEIGSGPPGGDAIVEYAPDGGEVIARFGEVAAAGKTTAETPEQVHGVVGPGGIAVNASGEVFVADVNISDNRYHRLMKFKPKTPGKFDEYEYAGSGQDIAAGFSAQGPQPSAPVVDTAGNVYVVSEENTIEEYDPSNPTGPAMCKFEFKAGNIKGITVDPIAGSPFFFSSIAPKRVHELGPCNEATGNFAEFGQIEINPERASLWGMTFDPLREVSPGRTPGALYGGTPEPTPDLGSGPGEPGQSSLGYVFAPIEESPPVIQSESVFRVTATSSGLRAVVNPEGFSTRYLFQYMTAASFEEGGETFSEAAEVPTGGGLVGEGKVNLAVAATALGLEPDTEYRFRVVASSNCSPGDPEEICEVPGDTQAFRTFPAAGSGLPDHRAYELVSPAEKHGGQVFPANPRSSSCSIECKPGLGLGRFPMQTSANGEVVAYEGTSFAPGVGAANENEYLAQRTSAGWQNTNPTPSVLKSRGGQGYKAFDEELTEAVLEQPFPAGLSPDAPPQYDNLYSQSTASPLALRPLEVAQPPNRTASGGQEFIVRYAGAADDLSRIFFAANDALTQATSAAPAAQDGGVGKFNLFEWERATGQLRLVNVKPGNTETEVGASFPAGSANAISADGSRAFWSDGAGQVYVRESAVSTVEIPDSGHFLAAASDGSKVLLDNGHLYDIESATTTDLTGGKGGFQGLAGQSDNLSYVYFVDNDILSGEEENSEGAKAQTGGFNLYAWSEGTVRFVATLLAGDNNTNNFRSDWASVPTGRTAKASPQGRYLAFLSAAPLTDYDNVGPASARCLTVEGVPVPGPCGEAFLYDSMTREIVCASCNPSGAAPIGGAQLPLIEGPSSLPQPNFLTDSGRLYLDSEDSLSPFDTNEGAQDVYQWEAAGVGTCTREGGCLALISSGRESSDSNLVTADFSGKNVFFTTRNRLVPADQDQLIDLYDGREFGGFPSESVLPPGECQGEACQVPQLAPAEPPPASATLTGPGNVKPSKACKKGRVKKKGKCVKKPKHKRTQQNRRPGGGK